MEALKSKSICRIACCLLGEVIVTFRYPKSSKRYECYIDSFHTSSHYRDSVQEISYGIVQSIRLIK